MARVIQKEKAIRPRDVVGHSDVEDKVGPLGGVGGGSNRDQGRGEGDLVKERKKRVLKKERQKKGLRKRAAV